MVGVIGIIAFLTVLGLSLLFTKVATVALAMTGLSHQVARFQARSAFTGTGFTTTEAEKVVTHPVRRQIIMILMIVRSAGLVTIIISLILSLAGTGESRVIVVRLLFLLGGVLIIWLLAKSKTVDRFLGRAIGWALSRFTDLDTRDYASLLRLSGEYTVIEIQVDEGDWLVGKPLKACYLNEEGVTVLGIIRDDGSYVGVPRSTTEIYAGDTLILYGRSEQLQDLDKRRADMAGEKSHEQAVDKQNLYMAQQDRQESEHKRKRQIRQQKK
jgi:K+/H+ antiporter YhaU regulatory subunit KhtT